CQVRLSVVPGRPRRGPRPRGVGKIHKDSALVRADVVSLSFDKLRFASADACQRWVKANGYDFGRCEDLGNRYVFGATTTTGQAITLSDGVTGIVRAAEPDPAETTEIEVFSTGPWAGTDW